MSDRVVLNVGGTRFETSQSTLSQHSAYFESLLSERWSPDTQELFIDRDGDIFKHFLRFMRSSSTAHTQILATLSDSDKVLLMHEADYFQMLDLVALLKRPTCTHFKYLTIPRTRKDDDTWTHDFTKLQDHIKSGWTIVSTTDLWRDLKLSFLLSKA